MKKADIDWFVHGTERIAKLKYTPKEGWLFTSEEANSLKPQAADDPFETPLSNRGTITLQTDFYLYDHLGNTRDSLF